jgi:hypothetical protein
VAYHRPTLERFAMRAGQLAQRQQGFSAGPVNIDEVGGTLGMTPADSRNIATYLQDLGWAIVHGPNLTLTPDGFEEIAKLRLPPWRRWLDKHLTLSLAIAGVVVGLLALLVAIASFVAQLHGK